MMNNNFYNKTRTLVKTFYESMPWQIREGIRNIYPSRFAGPLYKLLPMAVPFSLHIDPTNLCNFRCTFCPTGDLDLLRTVGRSKGQMTVELFKKIIDELSEMCIASGQKVNELHIYKDGEPLVHKEFAKMAAYVKNKNVAESVQTTTNAALLTKDRTMEIIDSGLDLIRVSVEHVNDNGYKKITKIFGDYNLVKENVKFLFEEKTRRKNFGGFI